MTSKQEWRQRGESECETNKAIDCTDVGCEAEGRATGNLRLLA